MAVLREPHKLEPTKRMQTVERAIYFDTESEVIVRITDDEVERAERKELVLKPHTPYLCVAKFVNRRTKSQRRKRYTAPQIKGQDSPGGSAFFMREFWRDVEAYCTYSKPTYMFAHNCKYDLQVSGGITYMVAMGYEVKGYSDESPFVVTLHKVITHSEQTGKQFGKFVESEPKRNEEITDPRFKAVEQEDGSWYKPEPKVKELQILSSTNYYQSSLAKLGESFGIEKLDFDHEEDFNIETALEYCDVDVDILEAAVEGFLTFVEKEELGGFSITVAGQAFKAFRHRFMPSEIYIHNDERAMNVERRAYSGGRTEVFRMGKIPRRAYYVDVNSMYPAVMRDMLYPTKLISFWETATIAQVKNIIDKGNLVCCDARIITDKPIYPVKSKRLLFPIGEFWCSLSTPEILKAISEGHLIEVKNVAIYEAGDIFSEYVNYFYHARLEAKAAGDKIHDLLYKLFLNCLYGKFGQRNIRMIEVDTADPTCIDVVTIAQCDGTFKMYKIFGGKVWAESEGDDSKEAYNSFPAIAAHVTAYARIKLWNAIETAGIENVYYCDTDSIICNDIGYQLLWLDGYIDNNELGKLKLEDYGDFEAFGVKDYVFHSEKINKKTGKRFDPTIKIKGVSKNARQLPTLIPGHLRFAVTQWGGFSTRLKNNTLSEYANRVLIKTLKREYNKGNIINDIVYPFKLNIAPEINNEFAEQITLDYVAPKRKNNSDALLDLIDELGYIKTPDINSDNYYLFKQLNLKQQLKYFRRTDGTELKVWCRAAQLTIKDLFNKIELNNPIKIIK